ncbi:hypothetical protein ABKN59_004313 [Abortiporus biennis]
MEAKWISRASLFRSFSSRRLCTSFCLSRSPQQHFFPPNHDPQPLSSNDAARVSDVVFVNHLGTLVSAIPVNPSYYLSPRASTFHLILHCNPSRSLPVVTRLLCIQ